jgi:uncharacterized membrane protein
MGFLMPWALVLAIPAIFVWWRWLRTGPGAWWRLAVLLLLVAAASGPRWEHGRGGSDVVVVLDRSASMDAARQGHADLLRLVGDQRRSHDRLAVVAVGSAATVVLPPQAEGLPETATLAVADDGSDLAAGLRAARALIGSGRSGRVLLVSDGEDTGLGLRAAAAGCAAAGIPVDVQIERRPGAADGAVLAIELPAGLRHGESFVGAVRFISDVAETRTWKVLRGDQLVAQGSVDLRPLRPLQPVTVTFADRPPLAKLTSYTVELDDHGDRRPGNNRAGGALRVTGGERVLVVGGDGTPGNVARALSAAGLRVQTRAEGPLTLAELSGASAVVLEQVPADRLGHAAMEAIAQWVEHLGGGLVMTGGRRSFGAGGYHRSPLERVSPVTMEIRDEHRKLSVAMAITMDRSGSMGVAAGPGRTKMDLADEGATAAIELLGPLDQIAVHAVDSEAHRIVTLTPVGNQRASIISAVRGIRSEGGGIYVYTALLAAGEELATATAGTRHLVLFADANDAEEPGDYKRLMERYRTAGITVSVVAMGTPKDSDAAFLEDVAKLGGGRITYASDPADIPRLFAQETVLVSRTAWVDQALKPEPKPALELAVPGLHQPWPTIAGYNLTYTRERAQVLAWCGGDPAAPAAASWRIGTGRSVALPFDLDDPKVPAVTSWESYAPLLAGLVRWAAGNQDEAPGALSAERVGSTAVLHLTLDPRRAAEASVAPDVTLVDAEGRPAKQAAWQRVDATVWEAVVPLDDHAVVPAAAVTVGGVPRAITGPALRLPMNPEVEPRYGRTPGAEVLAGVARESGGHVREDLAGLFVNPPSPGTGRELGIWLAVAALVVAVTEIAIRRMQLPEWIRLRMPTWPRVLRRGKPVSAPAPASSVVTTVPAPAAPAAPVGTAPQTPLPTAPEGDGTHQALAELRRRRGKS